MVSTRIYCLGYQFVWQNVYLFKENVVNHKICQIAIRRPASAAQTLPSTRAGGQDDGSWTNSLNKFDFGQHQGRKGQCHPACTSILLMVAIAAAWRLHHWWFAYYAIVWIGRPLKRGWIWTPGEYIWNPDTCIFDYVFEIFKAFSWKSKMKPVVKYGVD